MSGAHTPGPWAVEFTEMPLAGSDVSFTISGGGKIHICSGQSQEHLGTDGAIHAAECRANAYVLLAAPELLATLLPVTEALAARLGTNAEEWPLVYAACAAMAKAQP